MHLIGISLLPDTVPNVVAKIVSLCKVIFLETNFSQLALVGGPQDVLLYNLYSKNSIGNCIDCKIFLYFPSIKGDEDMFMIVGMIF